MHCIGRYHPFPTSPWHSPLLLPQDLVKRQTVVPYLDFLNIATAAHYNGRRGLQQPGGRGGGGGGGGGDGDGGDKRGNRRQKGEGREKVGGTRGKKQDGKGQEKRMEIEDENSKMRPHCQGNP